MEKLKSVVLLLAMILFFACSDKYLGDYEYLNTDTEVSVSFCDGLKDNNTLFFVEYLLGYGYYNPGTYTPANPGIYTPLSYYHMNWGEAQDPNGWFIDNSVYHNPYQIDRANIINIKKP